MSISITYGVFRTLSRCSITQHWDVNAVTASCHFHPRTHDEADDGDEVQEEDDADHGDEADHGDDAQEEDDARDEDAVDDEDDVD